MSWRDGVMMNEPLFNHELYTHSSYLFVDLVCIQCFPIGVSARMKCTHKLIVVNEAVTVHVEDVCHCIHLQGVGGKFYRREDLGLC